MNRITQRRLFLLVVIVFGVVITGCAQTVEDLPTSTVPDTPEITPVLPTETPEEVEQPGVVILLASATADTTQVSAWLPQVQEAAGQHGLTFEQRDNLTLESVPENLQLVVSLPPADNLQSLVDGLPQVQFLAVDTAGLTDQANLTILASASSSVNGAFLAGYIGAVQSEEYRVGMISVNSSEGQSYRQAFLNGVLYFCGTCLPVYPPYVAYPVYEEVSPGAALDQIQQAVNNLLAQQVQIIHLDPQLESEPVLQMLAEAGFYIIGSSAPPSGMEGNWVASVLNEPAMETSAVLESVLNGQALGTVSGSVVIKNTGASEARIANFNEILKMLESDAIDPIGNVN